MRGGLWDVLQDLMANDGLASRSQQVYQMCEETLNELLPLGKPEGTLASLGRLPTARHRRWKVDKSIYLLGGRSQDQTHLRKVRHFLSHKRAWAPREEVRTRSVMGVFIRRSVFEW